MFVSLLFASGVAPTVAPEGSTEHMTKLSIGTLAAVGLTAIVAPILLAAPASASVTGIKVEGEPGKDCPVAAAACNIVVTLSGSDATAPVTVKSNDAVVATATPTGATLTIPWTPPAKGKYTITVQQGSNTASLEVGIPGRAESNTGLGGLTDIIKLLTGSASK